MTTTPTITHPDHDGVYFRLRTGSPATIKLAQYKVPGEEGYRNSAWIVVSLPVLTPAGEARRLDFPLTEGVKAARAAGMRIDCIDYAIGHFVTVQESTTYHKPEGA